MLKIDIPQFTVNQLASFLTSVGVIVGLGWFFVEPAYTANIERKIEEVTQEKFDTINRNITTLSDKATVQQEQNAATQRQIEGLETSIERTNDLLEILIRQRTTTGSPQ